MATKPDIEGVTKALPDIPVVTSASDVPIQYADILYHVTWQHDVARLAFVSNNGDVPIDGDGGWKGRHVAIIAMPVGNVVAMRDYLTTIIDSWAELQSAQPKA